MIKINELRIGNLVSLNDSIFHVSTISDKVIRLKYMLGDIRTFNHELEPIPLTPEILEKAGFVWNEPIKHWTITWGRNGVHFIKKDDYYSDNYFSFQLGKGYYKIIDNLHQLQNLYFALTGEELEINL